MLSDFSEDILIEQPAIELFEELDWETANCFHETFGPDGTLGRETTNEILLAPRLRAAIEKLNSGLSPEAFNQVIEELARDRSLLTPVNANREIYKLLKDGVPVQVQDSKAS